MIRIAIIEDDSAACETLKEYIRRYGEEKGIGVQVACWDDAVKFLFGYKADCDLIFMDIDLPEMDGMTASAHIRETDDSVAIIFVTNMSQYAVKGYEVDALDFIVKPVNYYSFALKMNKAVKRITEKSNRELIVNADGNMIKISVAKLKYIEVFGHKLTYYTEDGVYSSTGTLKTLESELEKYGFFRCHKSYYVNVRHVSVVYGYTAVVGGDEIPIGHAKRKEFLAALGDWRGGGVYRK